MFTVWGYSIYLALSIATTVWVATTLFKNGRVFLVDSFRGNIPLADSVNSLLVVGFYLINVGFVSLALKYGDKPGNVQQVFESVSTKVGLVLLTLGVMHFFNIYIFSKMRERAFFSAPPEPEDELGETLRASKAAAQPGC
jgi:hypothetical protein